MNRECVKSAVQEELDKMVDPLTDRIMDCENQQGYVRVQDNQILSPDGNPVFLKKANWFNPYKSHEATQRQIIDWMPWLKQNGLNCLLFKANTWMVADNGRDFLSFRLTGLHNLVKAAEKHGIYSIINLFDVWARGKAGFVDEEDSSKHPINAWDRSHAKLALDYLDRMVREYMVYPRVIFELGNEMEHSPHGEDWENFYWMAETHLLKRFYAIAGNDRPIGVSQSRLWSLPVNVVFNHSIKYMPNVTAGDRPVVTNELAGETDLWRHERITSSAYTQQYLDAFKLARAKNNSGVCAASGLLINKINETAKNVLRQLGKT